MPQVYPGNGGTHSLTGADRLSDNSSGTEVKDDQNLTGNGNGNDSSKQQQWPRVRIGPG